MPIHRPDTVKRDVSDGAGNPCGPYTALLFSDAGGLTQFGAVVEVLPPGSRSSIKHWHATEDEMVYVLEGDVTLHEGSEISVLRPGDAATFRAGDPIGHCLENRSGQDVRYLVIGTRAPGDTVTYPDNDRILKFDREPETRSWSDLAGNPSVSPYERP